MCLTIVHGHVEAADGGCGGNAPVGTSPPNIPVETIETPPVVAVATESTGSVEVPTLPASHVSGHEPTLGGDPTRANVPMDVDSVKESSGSTEVVPVPTPTRAMLAYWSRFKVEKPHTSPMSVSSRTPMESTTPVVPSQPPTPVVATPVAEPKGASPGGDHVDPPSMIAAALNRATTVDMLSPPPVAKATPPQPPADMVSPPTVLAKASPPQPPVDTVSPTPVLAKATPPPPPAAVTAPVLVPTLD